MALPRHVGYALVRRASWPNNGHADARGELEKIGARLLRVEDRPG